MNLVGKIFVFLIMVMSVCFAMLAVSVYMTHVSWRDKVMNPQTGLKVQLKDEKNKTDDLRVKMDEQINKLKAEITVKKEALIKAENAKVVLATENKQVHEDNAKLKVIQEGELAKVQAKQQELNALQGQVLTLKEEVKVARTKIDEQFKAMLETTEVNHTLTMQVRNQQERLDQLTKDLTKAERVLASVNKTKDDPLNPEDIVIAGVVKGVVVEGRTIYVQLSIGSDDGLLVNHSLQIFRGTKPLGRVTIIRTEPDKSVGRVENPLGQIQVRDQVESRQSLTRTAGKSL